MDLLKHIRLLARYNEWMNAKLYETAAPLSPEQLAQNRGAFFGSVLGTLNHVMVGDIIWLKRLGTHPAAHRSLLDDRRYHGSRRIQGLRPLAPVTIDRNRLDAEPPRNGIGLHDLLDRRLGRKVDRLRDRPGDERLHRPHHLEVPQVVNRSRPACRLEGAVEHG